MFIVKDFGEYEVTFYHEIIDDIDGVNEPYSHMTVCTIGGASHKGYSYCSKKDIFNMDTGRKKAYLKAMIDLGATSDVREAIWWPAYFAYTGRTIPVIA